MRVVGGSFGSRRLVGPPAGVRPTSDRVRESLFARIGDLTDARVLDLFAGTGALAIEALSRGAAHAVLVDRSADALDAIRRNLSALGLESVSHVVRSDAVRAVKQLAGTEPFDLVFLDPPYESDRLVPTLAAILQQDVLRPNATVVVETAKRHSLAAVPGLVVQDDRVYGDTRITWLVREHTASDAETR